MIGDTKTTKTRNVGERKREKAPGEETANLRAVLIMLVMMFHSTIIYTFPQFAFHSERRLTFLSTDNAWGMIVGVIFYALFTPMMPLFFALSGYTFVFTLRKSTNYLILLKKKFWRLIVPLLFIGFCWMIPIKVIVGHPDFVHKSFARILIGVFVTGWSSGHLWFLVVLFGMFAVFGVCYHFFGLTRRGDAAVVVMTVICYVILHFVYMETYFLARFYRFYLFFVLGIMIHRYQDVLKKFFANKRNIVWVVVGVVFLAFVALSSNGNLRFNSINLLCAPFPLLLMYLLPRKSSAFMVLIGDNSMRLYLLHSPMVFFSFAYWPNINPILMIIINFFGFGSIALVLGLLMNKIHLGVLLGEHRFHAPRVNEVSQGDGDVSTRSL